LPKRGFDFANHFCEWTFEYSSKSTQGFLYYSDKFPDEQQQKGFFTAYLQRSNVNSGNLLKSDTKIQMEKLLKEAALFRPVSHFFWSIWALLQHHTAPMDFDFLVRELFWEYFFIWYYVVLGFKIFIFQDLTNIKRY